MAGGHHLHQVYADPSANEYGEQTFLSGMSLGGRVRLFVFLAFVAMAALGAGYVFMDRTLNDATTEIAGARDLSDLTAKLSRGILDVRMAERSFLAQPVPRHQERYDVAIEDLTRTVDLLAAHPDTGPVKERLTALNEGLARHVATFREAAAAMRLMQSSDGSGVPDLLAKASREIEKRLSDVKAPGLINLVGRLRAEEQTVLQSGGAESLPDLREHLEALSLAIEGTPLPVDDKRAVNELIAAYRTAIEAAVDAKSLQAEATERLDAAFTNMETPADDVLSFAENRLLLAMERERHLRELLRPAIGGAALGAVFLVLLFGVILMRSATGPVRSLASVAPRILGGDDTAPIPALGNHDEVGEVARALARLRTDVAETQRLRRDLDSAKSEAARHIEEAGRLRAEIEALRSAQQPAPQPPRAQPLPEVPAAAEPTGRLGKLWSGSISSISRDVALSSHDVSAAAFEAERTGTMIRGLNDAAGRLKEVEGLLAAISEQTNFLAYKGAIKDDADGGANRNLIVLSAEYRAAAEKGQEAGSVAGRLELVQEASKQANRAIREVGETLLEIKDAALDLASATSEEALAVTNRLMEQSEQLRGMLDELMGRVRDGDAKALEHQKPPSREGETGA